MTPIQKQTVNHIERTGRALHVLWDHFRTWELFATGTPAPILDRWYIATKTKALIKHDRILGETVSVPRELLP